MSREDALAGYARSWVEAAEARAVAARQPASVRPLGGAGRSDWAGWSVRAAADPWHVGRYRVDVAVTPRVGDPLALVCTCPWGKISDRGAWGWCRHRAAVGRWLERRRLVRWMPSGSVWRWNVGTEAGREVAGEPEDPFEGLG